MNPLKSATFGLAVAAFAIGGFPQGPAAAMPMSANHQKMMDSCMAMGVTP